MCALRTPEAPAEHPRSTRCAHRRCKKVLWYLSYAFFVFGYLQSIMLLGKLYLSCVPRSSAAERLSCVLRFSAVELP